MFTFLVKLVEDDEPTMALLMTRPEKTDWTELMKLDFPAPTGPISRILASVTLSLAGLNDLTDSISVSFTLNTLMVLDIWMLRQRKILFPKWWLYLLFTPVHISPLVWQQGWKICKDIKTSIVLK